MNQYMIEIDLPTELSPDFLSLVPAQRTLMNDLMEKRKILNYSLSSDRRKMWVIALAFSEDQVINILSEFPLLSFMDIQIHELAFYETAEQIMFEFSLN